VKLLPRMAIPSAIERELQPAAGEAGGRRSARRSAFAAWSRLCRRYEVSRPGEDGLACLVAASSLVGTPYRLHELRSRCPEAPRGLSLSRLSQIASDLSLDGGIVTIPAIGLDQLQLPVIAEWDSTRYVVVEHARPDGSLVIFDPAGGWQSAEANEAARKLGGHALTIAATGRHSPYRPSKRLRVKDLFSWSRPSLRKMGIVIGLSLLLQAYAAVGPLYMKVVLDELSRQRHADLMLGLAFAFALLAMANAGFGILRGLVSQKLQNELSAALSERTILHLLSLPLRWFHIRDSADIFSRLQGLEQIRMTIGALSGALLDLLILVSSLVLLFYCSFLFGIIAISGGLLLVALRMLAIPLASNFNGHAIIAAASEQGKRFDMLRSIQGIKAMAREQQRYDNWLIHFREMLARSAKSANVGTIFGNVHALAVNLMSIAVVLVGARAVQAGTLSIGTVTASVAYLLQFNQSVTSFFQQIVAWRLLDVQLDRLADIMLTSGESDPARAATATAPNAPVAMEITAAAICFGYPSGDPLFDQLDLAISAGEHVAIVGPSGSGKSTLLRILTGLYQPDSGTVLVDGIPIFQGEGPGLRRKLGVVLQDDELLPGTIAENIAFFDEPIVRARVGECLSIVGLADLPATLPLGLDTNIVNPMADFSGGQKQRLLIARALYCNPGLLVLDEATSHLDLAAERSIADMLGGLRMTRITVAHRPQTVAVADRIFSLAGGRLHEVDRAAALQGCAA